MNHSKIPYPLSANKNSFIFLLSYFSLAYALALLILICFNIPILGDSIQYAYHSPLNAPFDLGGGHHPGRHVSELFSIVPARIIAPLLGKFIDPSISMTIVLGTISAIYMSLLFWISTQYIKIQLSSTARNFFFSIFFSLSFFSKTIFNADLTAAPLAGWSHLTQTMVWGSLTLGLTFCWIFFYYIEHEQLPFNLEQNPYLTVGISIPILYFVTQTHDSAHTVLFPISSLLLGYCLLRRFFPRFNHYFEHKVKPSNLVIVLLVLHLGFIMFALIRTKIMGDRADSIVLNFNPLFWFNTVKNVFKWDQNLLFICTSLYGIYLLVKSIRVKFLTKFDMVTLVLIVSIFASLILCILGNMHLMTSQWILWIVVFRVLYHLYQYQVKFILLILPVILFSTILYSFIPMADYVRSIRLHSNDFPKLLEAYQYADKNNQKYAIIPRPWVRQQILIFFDWRNAWSTWMYNNGYTSRWIPLAADLVNSERFTNNIRSSYDSGNRTPITINTPEERELFYQIFNGAPYLSELESEYVIFLDKAE